MKMTPEEFSRLKQTIKRAAEVTERNVIAAAESAPDEIHITELLRTALGNDVAMNSLRMKYAGARRRIEKLEKELVDFEASFEIRWDADQRAIKLWQEATGKEDVWPDHADLCVFLMSEIDRLKEEGSPGVMHEVDRALYDLVVKERDFERLRVDDLKEEIRQLRSGQS